MRRGIWLLVALLLAGCGEEALYSRLGEQEANDMVALLSEAALPASKRGDSDGQFTVLTSPKAFPTAVALLRANGLPRERFETIGEIFAKEGFVSSPLEERARLNFALSQEIAHTITSIDGVVMARVHLAVPPRDELSDKVAPASASVFVKHRRRVDLSGSVAQIKALVVNGIENLPYGNVTVMLSAADGESVSIERGAGRPAPSAAPQETLLLGMPMSAGPLYAIGLLALFGGVLVWLGWFRRRAETTSTRAMSGPRSADGGRD